MATVTLLELKSLFFRYQGVHWSGTATGGNAGRLTDELLANRASDEFPFAAKGMQIRITSGDADGDLRQVVEVDRDNGSLLPNGDFSAAIANGDTYELWGDAIYGGTPLTNRFNDTLRQLRPVMQTRLPVEQHQQVYSLTSLAEAEEDVVEVWRRRLNYQAGGDYQPERVWGWRVFRLDGTGSPALQLLLPTAPAVSPTTTLDGALNNSDATITVVATADTPSPTVSFPSSGRLVIDNELIDYTGTTATTFTGCTRGVGNSVAAAHSSGANVDLANGTYYYVQHHARFTPFVDDDSTIDAIYQDWVVWEAILGFCLDRLERTGTDQTEWLRRGRRAVEELATLRGRFVPRRPTIIRAVDYD